MPEQTKDIQGFTSNDQKNSAPKGKNYLLAIGIDNYTHCPKLYNAVKDAKEIVAVLKKRFQFEAEHITEIYDQEATRKNIYSAFRKMKNLVSPNDNLLVYFSGHGTLDEEYNRGFWIPVNATEDTQETDEYVPNDEIRIRLGAIKSHHTFVMVDSCFSGSLFTEGNLRNLSRRKERDPSRWGLTAGRKEPVVDGHKGANSPFAETILDQLKNTESPLGVFDLCSKVLEVVSANAKQTPRGEPLQVAGHKGGQFVFHLRKDEVADWKETIEKGTLAAYQSFIGKYSEGKYANEAHAKIKSLKAETLWQKIQSATDDQLADLRKRLVLVNQYVDQYEDQSHYDEALNVGELLEYKKDFLKSKNSDFALRRFLKKPSPRIAGAEAVKQSAEATLAQRTEREQEQLKDEKEKTQAEEAARLKEEEIAREKAAKEQLRKQQEASQREQREAKEWQEKSKKEQEKRLAEKARQEQSRLVKEKKQKESAATKDLGPSPNLDQSNPFKKYLKYAWVLLLIPIGWGINSWISGDDGGKKREESVSEIPVGKPSTENETDKETQITTASPEKEAEKIAPLTLSYKWGKDQIIATINGGQAPYTVFLEKGNIKVYEQKIDKESKHPIDITKTYRKNSGKYILKIKDATGKVQSKPITIDGLQPKRSANSFTDSRDGQSYKTIRLKDGKKWMTENLNYNTPDSWCYDGSNSNCKKYGRLYTWAAAKKACPSGWHLPSYAEWHAMVKQYSGIDYARGGGLAAYKALISGGDSGFTALLGGLRGTDSYYQLGKYGYYWSSSEQRSGHVYYCFLKPDSEIREGFGYNDGVGYSCRCVED